MKRELIRLTQESFVVVYNFTAPVRDLRLALLEGSLGVLNPFPWAICAGNCLGWVVYGYYTRGKWREPRCMVRAFCQVSCVVVSHNFTLWKSVDPFVLAANLPGLILCIWLNSGAAKLQYLAISEAKKRREHWDASSPLEESPEASGTLDDPTTSEDALVMVPQEKALLRVLVVWAVVIVYVGWFSSSNPATAVGIVVNMNLVFFYGAPLQTIKTVIATKDSASIHLATMLCNWANTSFWIGYGVARRDFVIVIPNVLGLCLGLAQGVLKALFPSQPVNSNDDNPEAMPVLSADNGQDNDMHADE